MSSIDGVNANLATAQASGAAVKADAQIGSLSNLSVEIVDPNSALEDSAEELTFAKDNSKQQKLADRKQKASSLNMEERIEKLKKVIETLENRDADSQKRTIQQWRSTGANAQKMLDDLKQLGYHPSSSYIFLLNEADKEENSSIKNSLKMCAQELMSAHKSEIMAAINVASFAESNSDLGNSFDLSKSYSDITNQFKTPLEMLTYIKEKFSDVKADASIDFMLKALACDLNMVDSSQDATSLELVGTNLSKARSLNGAQKLLDSSLHTIESSLGFKTNGLSSLEYLSRLLKMSENRFIPTMEIRRSYQEVSKQNPEGEVLLAQELLKTARDMSVEVFDSIENRSNLIDGIQKLVDECITKEDEWLDAGGQ